MGTATVKRPAGDLAEGKPHRHHISKEAQEMKVAYVMSRFPQLTETFVLYEMLALEELGVRVEIYPLLRENGKIAHPEAARLAARAHFHPFLSGPILWAQWYFIRRQPRRYFRLWIEVLRKTWGSANFFLGALGILPKSVRFAYEMLQEGISHVHAHFATHPAVAALVIHRLTGISFSFTAHAADIQVERRMLDAKIEAAAFVVAISRWNKELMVAQCEGKFRDKIHVLHCGVDTDLLVPGSKNDAGVFQILSIGSLDEYKGHRYLIEACRLLRERGMKFQCHVVGEGPLRGSLEAQIRQAGLTVHVYLQGGKPRREVARMLAQANALALASVPTPSGKQEGIPVALMEAMACGLPVVSTAISGIPELVESERTGFLVPPFDAPALANALERLAQDSRLCSLMGEAGRRKVLSEFDLRANARELLRLFATLETHRDGGQDAARLLQIELSAVSSARELRKCDNLS